MPRRLERTNALPTMRVLIDATATDLNLRVFGMNLVERLLHSIRRSPVEFEEVCISVHSENEDVEIDHPVRRTIESHSFDPIQLRWQGGLDPLVQRITRVMRDAPSASWLIVSGDTIVDARLISQLADLDGNVFFESGEGDARGAILRLGRSGPKPRVDSLASNVMDLVDQLSAEGQASPMSPTEFDPYITNLRRNLDPYLFLLSNEASRRRVERFMFWSNYKGSTDFMTKYIWPPLVWVLVRPLARWRVHPNWVTAIDIAATFLAIPLWMSGWWASGFFLAYLMSLLDSVDGKLARLTFSYSRLGNVLDHGLDLVHPPFWYLAWAWGLSGGDSESMVFQASVWMFWLYVADRLCAPIFKNRTGRSIHGYLPVDVKIRTFISRRNVNLPFFTAAIAADVLRADAMWTISTSTFYAIVFWQAICVLYHAYRTVQFFNVKNRGESA